MKDNFNKVGFGCRVRKLRRDLDLTQTELAEKLDVTKVSVCGYERGERTPSLEIFCLLAKVFDVSTDYLLAREYKQEELDLCEEDIELIKLIKSNDKFYKYLFKHKERAISYLNKKIGDE